MDKSKALELYSFFVNEGYDLGDEQNFISALKDDKKRTELHGFFENEGYDVGEMSNFTIQEEQLTEEMMETGQRNAAPEYAMTEQRYEAEKKKDGESPSPDGVSADVVEETVVEEAPQYEEITPELVSQDEEDVVPKLNELYGNDFEFEQAGAGYDSVLVKSKKTGNKEIFTLDAFTDAGDIESAAEIKDFMQLNMGQTREEIEVDYESQVNSMTEDYKTLDAEAAEIKKIDSSIKSLIENSVIKSEDDPRLIEFQKRWNDLEDKSTELEGKYKGLLEFDEKLEKAPIVEKKFFTGKERIIDALPVSKGDVGDALSFIDSFTENYKFIPNFGDFIDGIGGAVALGDAQGDLVVVGNKLMEKANKMSSEDVQKMVEIQETMQNMPQSKEMQQYNKDYDEAVEDGSGWVEAWLTSLVKNPQASAEMMVSSLTAMVNRKSLERAMAVEAAAGSAAAVAGFAGPQALLPEEVVTIPAAMTAAIPVAMGVAGATVEIGISTADGVREYIEGLNEERKKNGEAPLDYNEETIRQVLSDKEAFNKIRNKALTRGATIGLVDAFLTRIGAKVGGKIFGKTGSRVAQAGFTAPFEMIGEGVGEGAAQYLSEGKLKFREIADEMSGGAYGTVTTMATSVLEEGEYKVNGVKATRKQVREILDSATPNQLAKMSIDITGDKRLSDKYRENIDDKQILDEMPDNVQGETRQEALDLEKERRRLKEAGITTFGKEKKIAEVNEKLKVIYEAEPVTEDVVTEEKPTPRVFDATTDERYAVVNEGKGEGDRVLTKTEYDEYVAPAEEVVVEEAAPVEEKERGFFGKILDKVFKDKKIEEDVQITEEQKEQGIQDVYDEKIKYLEGQIEAEEKGSILDDMYKRDLEELKSESPTQYLERNLEVLKGMPNYYSEGASKDAVNYNKQIVQESVDRIYQTEKLLGITATEQEVKARQEIIDSTPTRAELEAQTETKTEQDAIQEPSTEAVDVQEPARDSREVGEGDVRDTTEEVDAKDQVTEEEAQIAKEEFDAFNAMIDGKKPRARKGGEEVAVEDYVDVEAVKEEMDQLDPLFVNYTTPSVSEEIEVKPISEATDTSPIPQEVLDEYGVKDATELEKPIESFEGIPMVRGGMTDMLAGGKAKDSMGNDMELGGGIMFSLRNVANKGLAWAGIDRKGAKTQYDDAVSLYNDNKPLFERLWKEGKLPNGHVPMTITKMGDTGVNSNEAVFRYVLPKVKSVPLANRKKSFDALMDKMFEEKTDKKGEIAPFVGNQKAKKIRSLIDKYNVTTMDGFLEAIIKDANLRAKDETKAILALDDRAKIFKVIFSDADKGNKQLHSTALFEGIENDPFLLNTQNVYDAIAEKSLRNTPKGYVVAIVGIDVLNGGVAKASHSNYGFGPKGRPIALITNPRHQVDIFPEQTARAAGQAKIKTDKKGKSTMQSVKTILGQALSSYFNMLPAQGQKVRIKPDTTEQLIGLMRLTFPSVQAYTSQAEFNNILEDPEVREHIVDGTPVLGLTKDGRVYINPAQSSINTPIHEFGHIWTDMLRADKRGRELLAKGLSFVDSDPKAYEAAKRKYAEYDADGNMTNEELVREEALVSMIAAKGEGIVDAAQKSKFKTWLKAVMEYVKKNFKGTFEAVGTGTDKKVRSLIDDKMIKDLTLNQFLDLAIADLFSGELAFKQPKKSSTPQESRAKASISKETPIKATIDFKSKTGRTFKVSKEFSDQRHLDNYVKFRERKGDKQLGVTIGEDVEAEAPKPQKRRFSKKAVITVGASITGSTTLQIGVFKPIMIDGKEFARMTKVDIPTDNKFSSSEKELYTKSMNTAVSEGLGGIVVPESVFSKVAVDESQFDVNKRGDEFVITPKKSRSRFSKAGIDVSQNTLIENVKIGREAGINDANIKEVLKSRGFKVADINNAMTVNIDIETQLPAEFSRVKGGVGEATQMFKDVRKKLSTFAKGKRKKVPAKKLTAAEKKAKANELRQISPSLFEMSDDAILNKFPEPAQYEVISAPTISEVREKAMELLIENPVFKKQSEAVQESLIIGFDKTIGTRSNKKVQDVINNIKKKAKLMKEGVKSIKEAQNELKAALKDMPMSQEIRRIATAVGKVNKDNVIAQLERISELVDNIKSKDAVADAQKRALQMKIDQLKKNAKALSSLKGDMRRFIRQSLPLSDMYSKAQLNKVAAIIDNINFDNQVEQVQKLFDLVDVQRSKMKNATVKRMLDKAKKYAKKKRTGKLVAKAGSVEAQGQTFFAEAAKILQYAYNNDTESMLNLAQELSDLDGIDEIVQKEINGEKLTQQEQALLDRVYAFDTFGDIMSMELEDVMTLEEAANDVKNESAVRLKNARLERSERYSKLSRESEAQIKKGFKELFTINGILKTANQLNKSSKAIYEEFKRNGTVAAVKKLIDDIGYSDYNPISLIRNLMLHMGTMSTILDKGGKFFTDNIVTPLKDSNENNLRGYQQQIQKLDELANAVKGIDGGFKQVMKLLKGKGMFVAGIETGTRADIDAIRAMVQQNPTDPKTLAKAKELISKAVKERMEYLTMSKADIKAQMKAINETLDATTLIEEQVEYIDAISKLKQVNGITLTKDQLLRVYALSKNDVQREKLKGQGFTNERMAEIEAFLGPELIDFADNTVDYLSGQYYESVNDVHVRVNDVNLDFIDNYFPTRSLRDVKPKEYGADNFGQGFNQNSPSAISQRVDTKSGVDLTQTFAGALKGHLKQMERYKAYAETVNTIQKILAFPQVDALLNRTGLKKMYYLTIDNDVNPSSESMPFFQWLANRFYGMTLGFKLIQIPKQASSFINAYEQYSFSKDGKKKKLGVLGPDVMGFAYDYAKVLFFFRSNLKQARLVSAGFNQRIIDAYQGDIFGLESGSQVTKEQRNQFIRWWNVASASTTTFGDALGVMGYMAVYNRNIANGMSPKEALKVFNDYNETQQSKRGTEASPIQIMAKKQPLLRMITMFSSTMLLQMNKVYQSSTNVMRDISNKKVPSKSDIRSIYLNVGLANVLFVLAGNMMKLIDGDDEDKEEVYTEMLRAMLFMNQLKKIPAIGSAVGTAESMVDGKPPRSGIQGPLDKLTYDVAKSIKDEKYLEVVKRAFDFGASTNFDMFLGIIQGTTEGFEDEVIYDTMGLPKSARPEGKEEKKDKKEKSKYKERPTKKYKERKYKERP